MYCFKFWGHKLDHVPPKVHVSSWYFCQFHWQGLAARGKAHTQGRENTHGMNHHLWTIGKADEDHQNDKIRLAMIGNQVSSLKYEYRLLLETKITGSNDSNLPNKLLEDNSTTLGF